MKIYGSRPTDIITNPLVSPDLARQKVMEDMNYEDGDGSGLGLIDIADVLDYLG